jgi:hypothetical protein
MTDDEILVAKAVRAAAMPAHTGLDWSEEQHLKARRLSPKQRRRLTQWAMAMVDRLPPIAIAALTRMRNLV